MAQLHFTYRQIADIINMYTKTNKSVAFIAAKYATSPTTIFTTINNHYQSIEALERITEETNSKAA